MLIQTMPSRRSLVPYSSIEMAFVQYRRLCLIAKLLGSEKFGCAVAAIGLLFDFDHQCAEFISTDNQHFILTGIDCAGHRDVALPLVKFPKDCSRERLDSNDVA